MPDLESLLRYHKEYDLPDTLLVDDVSQTIFDDLLLLSALDDERVAEVIKEKTRCWLSMYDSPVHSVFKVKLFLSLGVVLCQYSQTAILSMHQTLRSNGIELWQYAHIEIPSMLDEQICLFVSKLDIPVVNMMGSTGITLAGTLRLRCEGSHDFSLVGADYLRYLVKSGDFDRIVDVFSGVTYRNETLATTFVDEMMEVKDGMALVDVASDLLFEMLCDSTQAERSMPKWKRALLRRISEQQTRIDAKLYFSPEYSALRVVMCSENFMSLIKAHELLSQVDPHALISMVTSFKEVLFVQDYFDLDMQTVLLNIKEVTLKERYLRHFVATF